MSEIEQLEKSVLKRRNRQLTRIKARYDFARAMGFSGEEATILQNRSEEFILKAHAQKIAKACDSNGGAK